MLFDGRSEITLDEYIAMLQALRVSDAAGQLVVTKYLPSRGAHPAPMPSVGHLRYKQVVGANALRVMTSPQYFNPEHDPGNLQGPTVIRI